MTNRTNAKVTAIVARADLTDMNSVIGARLLILCVEHSEAVGGSMADSLPWAFDKVMGAGAYAAFASDLYDSLRAA